MNVKKISQGKPRYIKTNPFHLIKVPWVTTSGDPSCPYEYNNGLHAAVHSLLAGMKCDKIKDVEFWLKEGRRQLAQALRALKKPGARVVPCQKSSFGNRKSAIKS